MEESLKRYLDAFKRVYFDGQFGSEKAKKILERKAKVLNLNQSECEKYCGELVVKYREFVSLLEDIYLDGHVTENELKEIKEFSIDLNLDEFEVGQLKKLFVSRTKTEIDIDSQANNDTAPFDNEDESSDMQDLKDEEIHADDSSIVSIWQRFKKDYIDKHRDEDKIVKLTEIIDEKFQDNYHAVSDHTIQVLARKKVGFTLNKPDQSEWYDVWLLNTYQYYSEKYPKLILDGWIFVANRLEFMAFIDKDNELNPCEMALNIMKFFFENGKSMDLEYMNDWTTSDLLAETYENIAELSEYAQKDFERVKKVVHSKEEVSSTITPIPSDNNPQISKYSSEKRDSIARLISVLKQVPKPSFPIKNSNKNSTVEPIEEVKTESEKRTSSRETQEDLLKTEINKFYAEAVKVGDCRVGILESINSKKLRNFLDHIGKRYRFKLHFDNVIAYYDDTLFGMGESGFVIFKAGIFINMNFTSECVLFKELISEPVFEESTKSKLILFKENKKIELNCTRARNPKILFNLMKLLYDFK